ncbi:MAG: hypothetical protein HYZ53_29140 [Planctomycetes bacterium]|nr:hypothetical protein [Planctomycetota bacterium]
MAVMEQLPRQGEEVGPGLACDGPNLGFRSGGRVAVHHDGESALVLAVRVLPGGQGLARGGGPDAGLEEVLAPPGEVLFDLLGPRLEHADGPEEVRLQVPAEVFGLDRSQGCGELETNAVHSPTATARRLIGEDGGRGSATLSAQRSDLRVGKGQDLLFDWGGLGCRRCDGVCRKFFTERSEQARHAGAQAAPSLSDAHGNRFFLEPRPQRARGDAREEYMPTGTRTG